MNGDGPARKDAESLCDELGLGDHIVFTGYIPEEETVGAYLESNLLVFPTYHIEGMPMVLFHSMACGLPIITTRIRAAADWMEDGEHCLYVPARDVPRLIETTQKVLDSQELRIKMISAGRTLVQRFESDKVASEFVDLYEGLRKRRAVSFWRRLAADKPANQPGSVAECD